MMTLNLVPDVWRRGGVKRHVGLLSLRRRSCNKEDDKAFDCSYIPLCLTMEGLGIQLGALRKERVQ